MTKILLLSIHPQYVDKIISGEKRFEYRKQIPTENVSHVVIYATAPVKRLLAIAEVEYVLTATPYSLWERTKYASGISRSFFREYFTGKSKGYAIKFGRVWSIDEKTALEITHNVPQSFSYFSKSEFNKLQQTLHNSEVIPSSLLFIAGIHGAGKTFFSEKYLTPSGWHCSSASSIIKNNNGIVRNNKMVTELQKNQEKLLCGIRNLRLQYSDIAIDGHFTLINEVGSISRVPQETFLGIAPKYIILLTAPCELIKQRLEMRDHCVWDLEKIENFQTQEQQYATAFANKYSIPIATIDGTLAPRIIIKQVKELLKMRCSKTT